MHTNIPFQFLSKFRYAHHLLWAVLLSCLIVAIAASIGRASKNLKGALTAEDPTLAVFFLRPEEQITDVTLLRAKQDLVDVLAETKDGPKWMRLRKGEEQWYISDEENLHE